jgi:hypothetical protein
VPSNELDRRQFVKAAAATSLGLPFSWTPASAQSNPANAARQAPAARPRREPLDRQAAYLRRPQAKTLRAGRVRALGPAAPARVSLASYQTAYRDQLDRDSCYAFASCAAMEAAYKRKYGIELHLSEQYAFHINKCFELYPGYVDGLPVNAHENNTSFTGFQGSSDLIAKLAVCAIPDAVTVPYTTQAQLEVLRQSLPAAGTLDDTSTQEQYDALEYDERHIPGAGRRRARFRVTDYAALPEDPPIEQVESVLAAGYEVVADIPGHCTLLIGYDRPARQWLVKNSWGEGGPEQWAYDDRDNVIFGGFYVLDVAATSAEPMNHAWWIGRWHMDHDGLRGELVIRRTNDFHTAPDQPTKLGNYYSDGKRHDVNGQAIDGGQGLQLWVADTMDRVPPGAREGQEFTVHVSDLEADRAVGSTTRGGKTYDVRLSRRPV